MSNKSFSIYKLLYVAKTSKRASISFKFSQYCQYRRGKYIFHELFVHASCTACETIFSNNADSVMIWIFYIFFHVKLHPVQFCSLKFLTGEQKFARIIIIRPCTFCSNNLILTWRYIIFNDRWSSKNLCFSFSAISRLLINKYQILNREAIPADFSRYSVNLSASEFIIRSVFKFLFLIYLARWRNISS